MTSSRTQQKTLKNCIVYFIQNSNRRCYKNTAYLFHAKLNKRCWETAYYFLHPKLNRRFLKKHGAANRYCIRVNKPKQNMKHNHPSWESLCSNLAVRSQVSIHNLFTSVSLVSYCYRTWYPSGLSLAQCFLNSLLLGWRFHNCYLHGWKREHLNSYEGWLCPKCPVYSEESQHSSTWSFTLHKITPS